MNTARHALCICVKYARCDWSGDLAAAGWVLHMASGLDAAHRLVKDHGCRVGLIVANRLDDATLDELDDFLRAHRTVEWIGVFDSALLRLDGCRDLIVGRLFDHHTAPADPARLLVTLGHAWGRAALRDPPLGGALRAQDPMILGHSAANLELLRQVRRVAKVDAPVLIVGESGSGKELAAQAIHRQSARAQGPFVPVNCGAIQATLIQSELFGHVKGAFTGATADGRGLIEAASEGTIFLDEIGDLSLDLQINLLRFLQEKTINRVGSTRSIRVNARVIAATHVNLDEAVAAGTFREDLYYRLNVVPLRVPALRERSGDIALLAEHYFEQFAKERGPQLKGFSRRALAAMNSHRWPGNVRELINRVRRAAVMAEGQLITPHDLGLEDREESRAWDELGEARLRAERGALESTLQQAGRNITQAARKLGVSRMTLYRLMAKHGIDARVNA
jgi:DNA-binding NtrC family response regulator